ncbi:MAG: ABC transporter substrate-binding protein [Candidatus Parvarchaeota archaeon]
MYYKLQSNQSALSFIMAPYMPLKLFHSAKWPINTEKLICSIIINTTGGEKIERNIKLIAITIVLVMISASLAFIPFNYSRDVNTNIDTSPAAAAYNENATFVWGRESFVDYLNPFNTHYMTTQTIMELVYPALVYWSANMTELVPYLATSWNINYTNHTAIFHLTHNAVWSDGVPITAQDVVWSFNEYKQPWTHENTWFKTVISTTALNNYTVEIKFTGITFIYVALPQVIVPYHIWKNLNATSYFGFTSGSTFVGGGPFLIANYTPNAFVELVKNPKFWDPNYVAHYSKLIVQDYTSDSTLLAGLESGYVSEAYVDSTMLPAIKNDTNLVVVGAPSTVDYFISYNQYPNGTGNPALRNIKVREALSYAINVSYLIKLGFGGYALPTVGVVPPGNPDYNTYLKPWPYNVSLANELLNESGYKYGPNGYREFPNGTTFKLSLAIPSGMSQWVEIAPAMVQEWKAIGVQVTVGIYDTATITAMSDSYSYDMMIGDWFSDANYGSELYIFTSSQLHIYANSFGYNNTTYDRIYSELVNASSPSEVKADAFELQNLTYQNATMLPLVCPDDLFVYNKQWTNVPANYSGMVPQYGYGWWILLDPEMTTTTTHVSTPSNTILIIGVAVVVIVIAVGIVAGMYWRSRHKKNQKP